MLQGSRARGARFLKRAKTDAVEEIASNGNLEKAARLYTNQDFQGFRNYDALYEGHYKKHVLEDQDWQQHASGVAPPGSASEYAQRARNLMNRRDDDVWVVWQQRRENLAVYDPNTNEFVAGGAYDDNVVQTFFPLQTSTEKYIKKNSDRVILSGDS